MAVNEKNAVPGWTVGGAAATTPAIALTAAASIASGGNARTRRRVSDAPTSD
jgi:hypothetical protein